MGSGKRKYPKRKYPKKGTSVLLGKAPKIEKKEINKENLKNLIKLWQEIKEKNKK